MRNIRVVPFTGRFLDLAQELEVLTSTINLDIFDRV